MSEGRARIEELRARFVALHGARKVARAEALALLSCASAVLEGWTVRRANAERAFARAWQFDEGRPFRRRARVWLVEGPRPRRAADRVVRYSTECEPPRWLHADDAARKTWSVATLRALESMAGATASEAEWFAIVGGLVGDAARAIAQDRPARSVIVYGLDGEPVSLFPKESRK